MKSNTTPKDVIFNKYPPMNPLILIADKKPPKYYNALNCGDVVFVKEDTEGGNYIKGKITALRSVEEVGSWIYCVETKVQKVWRNLNDFKVK